MKNRKTTITVATLAATLALIGFAAATIDKEKKDVSQKSSEASIVTNDNGSVARTYTESTVTTNGNMVTERRRETRTTMDSDGNMLESSTSEYAQSYPVGEEGMSSFTTSLANPEEKGDEAKVEDGFLGLKFGEVFEGTNFVSEADEPTLLRSAFTPKKALAGFDDYYVYVTPTTHRVVKVYACAKDAVDPGTSWRRHYLIEALEKRYNTWARPRSWCRPIYTFDIGSGRFVTVCLAGASRDYETVLAGWDDAMLTAAADEAEAIRVERRKNAVEKRKARVDAAASAF